MQLAAEIVFTLQIYQSLLFAVLCFLSFYYNTRAYSKKYLGWFMLVCTVYFGFAGFYYFGFYRWFQCIYVIGTPTVLLVIPLFYFYMESLTRKNFIFKKKDIYHLLPSILFFVLTLPFCFLPPELKSGYINYGMGKLGNSSAWMDYLTYVNYIGYYGVLNIQIIIYTFKFIALLKKHKVNIENNFSDHQNIDLKWLVVLLICFFSFLLINDLRYITGIQKNTAELLKLSFNIALLIIQFSFGLFGVLQKDIYNRSVKSAASNSLSPYEKENYRKTIFSQSHFVSNEKKVQADTIKVANPYINSVEIAIDKAEEQAGSDTESNGNGKKYNSSLLSNVQKQQLANALDMLMMEKEYLNEKLTIDEIAEKLKTNNRYLSQVINEVHNKNFYSYINTFRVKEAQKLLLCQKHRKYSITGISKMAGFSSKSSFNEAFKRIVGVTPTIFKQKNGLL